MKLLTNRIFLSALCLILAAGVSFFLLPRFYESKNATVIVLRTATDIPAGTKSQDKHLVSAEVGSYGLPEDIMNDKSLIIGKIAQTDIAKGDYYVPPKLGGTIASELLDRIAANNQPLVTISVPSIGAGLSSHLRSGDIVTVAVFADKSSNGQSASPQVIIYPELKKLEVYSAENARAQDAAQVRKQQAESQSSTGDPIVKAVTLIVTEAQAERLIQACQEDRVLRLRITSSSMSKLPIWNILIL